MNSTGSGKSSTVSRSVHVVSVQSDSRRFLRGVTQWLQVDGDDAGGRDTESCYETMKQLCDNAVNLFVPAQILWMPGHVERWLLTMKIQITQWWHYKWTHRFQPHQKRPHNILIKQKHSCIWYFFFSLFFSRTTVIMQTWVSPGLLTLKFDWYNSSQCHCSIRKIGKNFFVKDEEGVPVN